MVDWDAIEIELLPEERTLLLEYGYPFPDAKNQLEDHASSDGPDVEFTVTVAFGNFEAIAELDQRTLDATFRAFVDRW